MNILGIFAKEPVSGRVKTRLARDLGADLATDVYISFVETVLARTRAVADLRILAVDCMTERGQTWFGERIHEGDQLWEQPAGDLGERLSAFVSGWPSAGHENRLVIIGTDSPSMPLAGLGEAFQELARHDVVLGPSTDGGYYLIGLSGPHLHLFAGIDWGSPEVLSQTLSKVQEERLTLHLLSPWYDVDTLSDLRILESHLRGMQIDGGFDADLEQLLNRLQVLINQKTSGRPPGGHQ